MVRDEKEIKAVTNRYQTFLEKCFFPLLLGFWHLVADLNRTLASSVSANNADHTAERWKVQKGHT